MFRVKSKFSTARIRYNHIVAPRNRFASKTRPSHCSREQVSRRSPSNPSKILWGVLGGAGTDDRTKKKRVPAMGSRCGADEIWCFYCAVKYPRPTCFMWRGPSKHIGDERTLKNSFLKLPTVIKRVLYILCCCCCSSKNLSSLHSDPTAFVVSF